MTIWRPYYFVFPKNYYVPLLEGPTAILMDNASYHTEPIEKKNVSRKEDIKSCIDDQSIRAGEKFN